MYYSIKVITVTILLSSNFVLASQNSRDIIACNTDLFTTNNIIVAIQNNNLSIGNKSCNMNLNNNLILNNQILI